ncbi:MAG: mechanosensitive ion channel family protein, partial [Dehalococcoidia bacterium]
MYSIWDAIGIFAGFTCLAAVFGYLMRRVAERPPAGILRATPVPYIVGRLSGFAVCLFLALALVLSIASLDVLAPWSTEIRKAALAVTVVVLTAAAATAIKATLEWSASHLRADGKAYLDEAMLPVLRLSLVALAYAVGGLVLLEQLDVSIAPMVAGVGIGGLAIALALQPTLSNFIAGTQIASDRLVRSGDYIEIENDIRGYIMEVGWRSTRIRTAINNLVVIPNSKLAESVITNFSGPAREIAVVVKGGVSFNSDLAHVEGVVTATAKELVHDLTECVPLRGVWFGYEAIGEYNVTFAVWVHATDRLSSLTVTSELIKRLFQRFQEEGI